jgi:hypothetical protein
VAYRGTSLERTTMQSLIIKSPHKWLICNISNSLFSPSLTRPFLARSSVLDGSATNRDNAIPFNKLTDQNLMRIATHAMMLTPGVEAHRDTSIYIPMFRKA